MLEIRNVNISITKQIVAPVLNFINITLPILIIYII